MESSSPTRDRTQTPCIGSAKSQPLEHPKKSLSSLSRRHVYHQKDGDDDDGESILGWAGLLQTLKHLVLLHPSLAQELRSWHWPVL